MLDRRTFMLIIIIGVVAGIVGILFTNLMHFMQHITYSYTEADQFTFGMGVVNASPDRRLYALLICGTVAGLGWVAIHRYGSPLVDIKDAIKDTTKKMPPMTTILHATLQILTVGMGSPLGREVAPREASSAITTYLLKYVEVPKENQALLIACAAGAGLAAVYNSPLSAAIFVLETLLVTWNKNALIAALLCCSIGAWISRLGLGDVVQYSISQPPLIGNFPEFSLVLGVVVAIAVVLFDITQSKIPKLDRKSPWMILVAIVAFGIVGFMSMKFPSILGNGKAGNQLTFTDLVTWQYAMELFSAKWIAVLLALLAGAYGGRITPSMMLGSTLGLGLATVWSIFVMPVSLGVAAFLGAVIFLGLAQKMPLTSAIFMLELSRFSVELLFPIALGMGIALFTQTLVKGEFNL